MCELPASSTGSGFLGAGLLVLIFFVCTVKCVYLIATHQILFYFIVADFCFSELLNSTPLVNTSVDELKNVISERQTTVPCSMLKVSLG